MQKKNWYLVLAVVVIVGLVLLLRQTSFIQALQVENLRATIVQYGALAPFLYIGVYVLTSLLFLPASPLTIAGGALFGPWYGTLYTVIGATIGATLAFFLARVLGSKYASAGTGAISQRLKRFDDGIARNGFITVLYLRFVPLFPFNGLNIALGLTSVSFKKYVLGTLFGIIPGTFAYVYFGNSLTMFRILPILGAVALVILLTVVGKYSMRWYDTKTKNAV